MTNYARIQSQFASDLDVRKICTFDVEFVDHTTSTLIHSQARFLYFISGSGVINVNGIDYTIKPNSLISIVPWDISTITKVDEPLEFYKVVYNSDYINGYLRTAYNPTCKIINLYEKIYEVPIIYLTLEQSSKFLSCFSELRCELGEESTCVEVGRGELSDTYVMSILVKLLVLINRVVTDAKPLSSDDEVSLVSKILRYIYSHLQEKITLEKLSKLFYLSESSITKYLQLTLGFSFGELINEMRIGKSLDLLIYSDLSLQEIAEIIGFNDASHFLKAFVVKEGITPNEYRKAWQNNESVMKKREKDATFKVLNYVHDNFTDDKISAVNIAKKFNISLVELNHIMMFQVEKSFNDYVDWLRIGRACELLITTDNAVTDIAIEVGYNTSKTFSRTFSNIKKVTPGQFRRTVKLQGVDGTVYEGNNHL